LLVGHVGRGGHDGQFIFIGHLDECVDFDDRRRRFAAWLLTLPCLPHAISRHETTWTKPFVQAQRDQVLHDAAVAMREMESSCQRMVRFICTLSGLVANFNSLTKKVAPSANRLPMQRRPPSHRELGACRFSQPSPGANAKGSANEKVKREEPKEPMVAPKRQRKRCDRLPDNHSNK
jgi:hypothetical protein